MGKSQVSKIKKQIKKGKAEQKVLPMVPAITSLIRQVSAKTTLSELETKYVTGDSISNISFNSSIDLASEFRSLIPTLMTGNGNWLRQGNQVTPITIRTDFYICLAPYTRTQNLVVNLWLLENRSLKNFDQLIQTSNSNVRFLKSGASSITQQYNGNLNESNLPIYNEQFKLLKHYQFQLTSNVGLSEGDTTAGNAPNIGKSESYKHIKFIYDSPKVLKYNTPGDTYPSNCAPFWCIGYAKVDGSSPDFVNQNIVVTTNCSMTYKDA